MPTLGPRAYALRLAEGKAAAVAARRPDAWILAGDQLALLPAEGPDAPLRLLHKPADADAAVAQLMSLAGRTHELVSAVVLRGPAGELHRHVDVHRMTMREFSREEATRYVEAFAPLDSVGAYHVEDAGIRLFARIEGEDATAIEGLPLLGTLEMLRAAGQLPPIR